MAENKNVFVDGLRVYKPSSNAPDFIKLNFQVFVDDLINFLQKHKDEKGQVKFTLKKSREKGVLYLSLDTYKKKETPVVEVPAEDKEEDLPF